MGRVARWGVLAAALLAGCGGGDDATKRLTVLVTGAAIDGTQDPSRPNFFADGMAVQRTLVLDAYEGLPQRPDLAEALPEVSPDRRTIKVRLRRGIRFGPPVDREVRSGDVKYAIERSFKPSVASPSGEAYFSDLVGVEAFRAGRARGIRGIRTPDDRTLELRLRKPTGDYVALALGLGVTAPVPQEYARPHDRRSPSTYAQYVVGTGPYRFDADAKGRIRKRSGGGLRLVRNPNWDPETDVRPAHLDEIVIRGGFSDPALVVRKAIADGATMTWTTLSAPAFRLVAPGTPHHERLHTIESATLAAMSMNTTLPPLDDVDVRRAIIAGFDRRAIQQSFGGPDSVSVATHAIGPSAPGFEAAGGYDGPGVEWLGAPEGDLELAAKYLRRAGYASGRYEGKAPLTLIGLKGQFSSITEIQRNSLERLGFRVRVRSFDPETAIVKWCSVPARRVHFCLQQSNLDVPDPRNLIEPFYSGDAIVPQGNQNVSQIDEPEIDAAIRRAAETKDEEARVDAWAEVDRLVARHAPVVPMFWPKIPYVASEDVSPVINRTNGYPDPTFMDIRR